MSRFTIALFGLQAVLIQMAFSQTFGSTGLGSFSAGGLSNIGSSGIDFGSGSIGFGGRSSGLGLSNAGLGLGNVGSVGFGSSGLGNVPDVSAIASLPVTGPYGGTGYGELSVGGNVDAAGNTIVTGQVPVLGAVSFGGNIPAGGVVSLAGNCPCGGIKF